MPQIIWAGSDLIGVRLQVFLTPGIIKKPLEKFPILEAIRLCWLSPYAYPSGMDAGKACSISGLAKLSLTT